MISLPTRPLWRQDFRIEAFATERRRLHLKAPLDTGAGRFRQRELLLIELRVRVAGKTIVGWGEAAPLPGWSQHSLAEIENRALGLELDGRTLDLIGLEALIAEQANIPLLEHAVGTAALNALSAAAGHAPATLLADARGCLPLAEVPVQHTLGAQDFGQTLAAIEAARRRGFTTFKLKVGAGPLARDIERIHRVAERFGDLQLRLDANGAWTPAEALEALRVMPVSLIEQPVAPADLPGLLENRPRAGPLIAADESAADPASAGQLIAGGRVDALVIKPCTLGGPVRIHDILLRAQQAGMDVIFSNLMESALGRSAAIAHAAAWPEFPGPHGLATAEWFAEDLGPAETIRSGLLSVPARAIEPEHHRLPARGRAP